MWEYLSQIKKIVIMGKKVFLDNGANLTSKGLIKGETYEIGDKKESTSKPGMFMCTVSGPGLTAPVNMWESTILKEFADIKATIPAQSPAQTIQQPVNQAQQAVQQQVQQPSAPKAGVPEILQAIEKIGDHLSKKISAIEISKPQVSESAGKQDLLLSELIKLDFNFLNIKMIKADGKVSIVLVMDGTEPLSISSKDLSAESVVSAITSVMSEQSMIIRSIADFRKRTAELLATKEQEAKAAAKVPEKPKADAPATVEGTSTVKSRRAAAEKAAAQAAIAANPIASNEPEPDEPEPDEPDFEAERRAGGLTSETESFQLV